MGAKSSKARWIGGAVLVSAVVTASVTTVVLTSRKPTPVVEKQSVVYVPLMLGGTDLPGATGATAEPVSTTQLTRAELPRAAATAEPAEEAAPEGESPQVGRSLGEALDSLRARYDAATALAPAPVVTAAPMSTQPAPAVTEEPPPTMTMAQQPEPTPQEPPQVGAGAFTTTPTSPFAASGWQSNPNAGAGQFSTDKGSIDPNIGAGPFTTEWHTPIIRY